MKFFIASFLVFSFIHAYADNELRSRALQEAEAPRVAREKASSVSVTTTELDEANGGILRLQQPQFDSGERKYKWIAGVQVQSFQPSGALRSPEARLHLSDQAAFYLPSLQAGLRFPGMTSENYETFFSVVGEVGYISQPSHLTYDNSLVESGHLSTILSEFGFIAEHKLINKTWGLHGSAGMGNITYSHSGTSAFAQFSENANFYFAKAGVNWNLPSWQVLLTYANRNLLEDEGIALPTDSVELGTRYLW